jgi:acetyl-CoA acetyltransferase
VSHGSPEVFLVDGVRIQQGRYGGVLSGVRRGLATTLCVGEGQGVAMLVERA